MKNFVVNPEGIRLLRRSRRRSKNIIKINLNVMGFMSMDLILISAQKVVVINR